MIKNALKVALSVGVVAAAMIAGSSAAHADEYVAKETVYEGPNRALLWSGVFTAGVPYVASAIVGAESGYTPDRSLFIPIAGPWVDLAQRSGCPVAAATCNTETLNKVLLVGDGIFQGIGALTTVYGFLSPERHEVVTTSEALKPTIHVAPANVASGYGLAAVGSF
jgi:hypothetical protein